MKRFVSVPGGFAFLALSIFLLGSTTVEEAKDTRCCFTNSHGYQGVCEVTPGEDETCASILAYLNNPQSVGKNYCGNTKVRGGWKQVSCEEKGAELIEKTCRMPPGPPS